ncbi:hypothetical protein ACSTLX_25235, partial [Vibrio parahaemolyticus]
MNRETSAAVPESDDFAAGAPDRAQSHGTIETNRHREGVDLADAEPQRFNGFSNPGRAYWSGHLDFE